MPIMLASAHEPEACQRRMIRTLDSQFGVALDCDIQPREHLYVDGMIHPPVPNVDSNLPLCYHATN
jgi:hypothetical protein